MVVSHLRAALSRTLRSRSRLPASSHAPPLLFYHRLLSSSAAAASASSSSGSFAAVDYLVSRCGLTQAQALKVPASLSHIRSPANPDAVLAYLESTLGIPAADVTRIVVTDPTFLCADVERNLALRVADLHDLGLSRDEITSLLPFAPNSFRNRSLRSNLEFWLAELGSFNKVLQAVRSNSGFLTRDVDKVGRSSVAFLRQCGLDIRRIVGTNRYSSRLLTMKPELLKEVVHRVEELGIKRGQGMFLFGLALLAFTKEELVARRICLLHKVVFSKDDALTIVRKHPLILGLSEQKIKRNVDFLTMDTGLEMSYIVRRPLLLTYSVERRLLPRHCLLKVLREKGLLKGEVGYCSAASMSEKMFIAKFVHPYKNQLPGLVDDYASKRLGKATDAI
ncbi:hypothetical protein HU200_002792 [Digitaria exilis]|uniref:Uncharacterized protein n=1 Tax=Digitaria exilis TaxID=1010633 RepID=A0A835FUU1_9POAL|nr:hypothetical protein HU200_011948 [Digitaria exilis]KAF8779119.1 hypothetical protein HU200_002792 [Digitaria exilis]